MWHADAAVLYNYSAAPIRMTAEALRRAIFGTGLLFDRAECGSEIYLGSCFSVFEPGMFVTAAHCLKGVPLEQLWVNHFGGEGPKLFTRVMQIEWVEETDLAVFLTEAPEARWAKPFQKIEHAADFGEEVAAFGYPQDLMSPIVATQTPRMLRGIVQRPFAFQSLGKRYVAYELSFPCPPGLSGAPLFLLDDPSTIIGAITGNFETNTILHSAEERVSASEIVRHEARSVITYGVAANISGAIDALEKLKGRSLLSRF